MCHKVCALDLPGQLLSNRQETPQHLHSGLDQGGFSPSSPSSQSPPCYCCYDHLTAPHISFRGDAGVILSPKLPVAKPGQVWDLF